MKCALMIVICLLTTGCAALSVRGSAPSWSGTSKLSLNAAASCLIKQLNSTLHSDNPLVNSITHQAVTIDPDRVLEVSPQQTITVGAEIYYIRVEAIPSGSNLELFANSVWTGKLSPVASECV